MPKKSSSKTKKKNPLEKLVEDVKDTVEDLGKEIKKGVEKVKDEVESAILPIETKFWDFGKDFRWPEMELENIAERANVGICFSGGGSRSATATLGQLRALRELNVLDKVRYVSSISGGTWSLTPYMYLPEKRNEDFFFGEIVKPANLRLPTLRAIDARTNQMERAISDALLNKTIFLQYLKASLGGPVLLPRANRKDEIFSNAVGEAFLAPFDLHKKNATPRVFTWKEKQLDDILKRNKHMERNDFSLVQRKRPYYIGGGVIHKDMRFLHYEFTPLYVGASTDTTNLWGYPMGGGYVEPIGFDTFAPFAKLEGRTCKVNLGQTFHRLSLSDLIGTSGSAPSIVAHVLRALYPNGIPSHSELLNFFSAIFPRFRHWPVQSGKKVVGVEYDFGDAGYIDSFGIIPLLKRGVKNIICFINTGTALGQARSADMSIESAFPLLFGEESLVKDYPSNASMKLADCQVFHNDHNEWNQTLKKMLDSRDVDGGPICSKMTYTTKGNTFYGIAEGQKVTVMFFYLGRSKRFEENLRPEILADKSFKNFPHYDTFMENPISCRNGKLSILEAGDLFPEQVSLLSQFTSWCVNEKKKEIEEMLR